MDILERRYMLITSESQRNKECVCPRRQNCFPIEIAAFYVQTLFDIHWLNVYDLHSHENVRVLYQFS